MLDAQQIEQRLPVWCALSELFVDTEFDAASARTVAESLRRSRLPVPELERILRDEVAPVFHRNAAAVNWTGWPADEVRRLVTEHLRRCDAWPARLAKPLRGLLHRARMTGFEPAWREVMRRLAETDKTRQ